MRLALALAAAFLLCLLPGCTGQPTKTGSFNSPAILQTEDYPKQIGYDVKDSASSGGRARVSFSKTGLIVWGQYLTLPAGRYVAEFRVKAGSLPANPDPVLALMVTSGGVTNVGVTANLALTTLTAAHLKPLYRYAVIPVAFTSSGDTDLEFRVQVLQPGAFVWSDYIKITKGK